MSAPWIANVGEAFAEKWTPDGNTYCEAAARDRAMPGLFDVIASEERTEEAEATA